MGVVIEDAGIVARATWAVASSPAMPRSPEWMRWFDERRAVARRHNPPDAQLQRAIADVVSRAAAPARQPRSMRSPPAPAVRRLYAGLVSFVDDYRGPFPRELFPRREVEVLRARLRSAAGAGALTIDEQLDVALSTTGGDLCAAAVLLHAVTRMVARNRDTRALGELSWEQRLDDAGWIAPFPPAVAGRGDAPGDTYHYWANFAVAARAALEWRLAAGVLVLIFFAGPVGMGLVRGRMFGRTLFAGTHARCDRMGLRHGAAAAHASRRIP